VQCAFVAQVLVDWPVGSPTDLCGVSTLCSAPLWLKCAAGGVSGTLGSVVADVVGLLNAPRRVAVRLGPSVVMMMVMMATAGTMIIRLCHDGFERGFSMQAQSLTVAG
jgi:hypothetical protein